MSYGKNYRFTLTDGAITQVFEQERSRWQLDRIEANDTWTANGTQVIKASWDHGRQEYSLYDDANGDGIYQQIYEGYVAPTLSTDGSTTGGSDTTSGNNNDAWLLNSPEMYRFDIVDAAVTAVYELENGRVKNETMDWNETWAVQGSDVVQTDNEHGMLEVTTYSDVDGDGLYSIVSRTYTAADGTAVSWNRDVSRNNDHERWQGSENDDHYAAGLGDDSLESGFGDDDLWGGDGNDSLTSGEGNDYLDGGLGNDELYAGAGDDTVTAGDGDDLIVGGDGAGDDHYDGGAGVDVVKYSSALAGIRVDLSSGVAASLRADSANIGSDVLSNIENIIAGSFNDLLTGDDAANRLEGRAGNDVLIGGAGRDVLLGGTGRDVFKLLDSTDSAAGAATRDLITDFKHGQDKIDLSAIDARTGGTTNDAFTFIKAGALNASNANGAVWFANGVLNASTDSDTAAEIQIQLNGVRLLTVSDLLL